MVSLKQWFLNFDRPQLVPGVRVRRHPEARALYLEALEVRQLFAGTPAQLAFSVQPSQVAALSPVTPSIQVAIEDVTGQTTTDTSTVTLVLTQNPIGGGVTTTSTLSVKAVNGIANFTNVAFTTAGLYSISAADGVLAQSVSNLFTVTQPAAELGFVQPPTGETAGAPFGISVGIEDANGNIVTTDQSNVTISIGTGPSGATIVGTTTIRAINGIATFNGISLPKAGTYTINASDSSFTSFPLLTSSSFIVGPGAPAGVVFAQQPVNTPGSAVMNPSPVVDVVDANGNIVSTDNSTITLSVANGPTGGLPAGDLSAVAVNGVATFSNISFPTFGRYTLEAIDSDSSLKLAISNSFAITGPPAQLAFQIQPTQTTVGHVMTKAITVLVEDSGGNVVTADNSAVTLSIASGPGGTISGTTTVNAVNGLATFPGLSFSAMGTYTLDASDGVLTNATSNSFLINGLPAKLEFVQQPGNTAAGSPISNNVTINVEDSAGNVVIDDSSLVTLALNGTVGSLGGITEINAFHGSATFTDLIPSLSGTFTLSASDAGLASATSSSFIVAPPPFKVVIIREPVPVAATSVMPPVIVHVENAEGLLVGTDISKVSLQIVSGPSNATFGGTTAVNAVAGVATFSNLTFSTPGNYQLVAFDGSLATDTSISFTVTGPPAKLVISQQPQSSVIAGQTMSSFTVSVRDSSGNLVTTDNSVVRLAISTGPTGGAIIGNATANAVNGTATFTGLAFDTAGTSYKLTASDAALTGATTSSFKVTPEITTARLFLAVNPTSSLVGKSLTGISIDVVDKFGNVITTDSSSVTLSIDSGPGDLSGTMTVKASKGIALFTILTFSQAGTYTLLATDAKFSSPSTVTNSTISFTTLITPAITTIAAPSVSKSYNLGSTITLSDTIKSLVSTPTGFTGTASIVDAGTTGTVYAVGTVSSNGSVKFNTNNITQNFTGGTHAVRVIYAGDNNHTGGQSPVFNLVVAPVSTTTVEVPSATTLTTSQTLTLTINVNTFAGATIARSGMIVIKDNGTPIANGTLTLSSSTAAIDLSALTAGTHKFTALYEGDDNYKTSTSSAISIKVT